MIICSPKSHQAVCCYLQDTSVCLLAELRLVWQVLFSLNGVSLFALTDYFEPWFFWCCFLQNWEHKLYFHALLSSTRQQPAISIHQVLSGVTRPAPHWHLPSLCIRSNFVLLISIIQTVHLAAHPLLELCLCPRRHILMIFLAITSKGAQRGRKDSGKLLKGKEIDWISKQRCILTPRMTCVIYSGSSSLMWLYGRQWSRIFDKQDLLKNEIPFQLKNNSS